MYDLVGANCAVNADQKYIDSLREMWRSIRDEAIPEFKYARVTYENGTPVIPWKQATELMKRQMATMLRVNHG